MLFEESKENASLTLDDQMRMGYTQEMVEMMTRAKTINCMNCEDYKADHLCIPCGHMVICNNSKCHEFCNAKCPKCKRGIIDIYRVRDRLGDNKCVICQEYPADHVGIPCGHKISCNNEDCRSRIKNSFCVECGEKVQAVQRLRTVNQRR